jgi:hypothetical protein
MAAASAPGSSGSGSGWLAAGAPVARAKSWPRLARVAGGAGGKSAAAAAARAASPGSAAGSAAGRGGRGGRGILGSPAAAPRLTRRLPAPASAPAGSDDHTARVWDLRKKGCLYTIPAHKSLLSSVRYEPGSGAYLMTASYDALAKVGAGGWWPWLALVCTGAAQGGARQGRAGSAASDDSRSCSATYGGWRVARAGSGPHRLVQHGCIPPLPRRSTPPGTSRASRCWRATRAR